jgi:hypothetical protein
MFEASVDCSSQQAVSSGRCDTDMARTYWLVLTTGSFNHYFAAAAPVTALPGLIFTYSPSYRIPLPL